MPAHITDRSAPQQYKETAIGKIGQILQYYDDHNE